MNSLSSTVLGVHQLEDRLVPTTYKWLPQVAGSLWSNPDNWAIQSQQEGIDWEQNQIGAPRVFTSIPGAAGTNHEDKVYFLDPVGDCIVDVAAGLDRLQINPTFKSKVMLKQDISTYVLWLNSSDAELCGFRNQTQVLHKTVTIASSDRAGSMNFDAGILGNVTILAADPLYALDITITVSEDAGGTRSMHGTQFDISHGSLVWQDGDVAVTNPTETSSIVVNDHGAFVIKAGGFAWGTSGDTKYFQIVNHGFVVCAASGTAKLGGDYTTNFVTKINSGTLEYLGKAEQTAGSYTLRNGSTVKVSGPGSQLDIYDGLITGGGTVSGNLALGYGLPPGMQDTHPVIVPTLVEGGTITITGDFTCFSSGGGASFMCDAGGNYTKLVVGGNAHMQGTLTFVKHPDYKPLDATLVLIKAATVSRHFSTRNYAGSWYYGPPDDKGRPEYLCWFMDNLIGPPGMLPNEYTLTVRKSHR